MRATAVTPEVDRRQLQQIVAGLSEGVLIADPGGAVVWANEAALALHGCSRLEELAGAAAAYRRRFILRYRNRHPLRAKQYPLARLVAGERVRDLVVEVTRRDDPSFFRVHQVGGLVLTGSSGGVESLVLVMQDLTERFSAEERFERAFSANPAPALICRLADLRYIKVNQGFLEMSGHAREQILESSAYQLDVLEEAQDRDEALACLREGRTIAQREALLRLPGNGRKFVIVAGQPIEVGDEACMLFTFIDLEPRKRAETALRQSEARFATAFRLAPVPMAVCALPEGTLVAANEAFVHTLGQSAGQAVDASLRKLLAAGESLRNREVALRDGEGLPIDCLLSVEPITIDDVHYALCAIEDVTERKRSEVELITAIEAVMQDTSWFSRTVIEKLAQLRQPGGASAGLGELTPREREVLGMICAGRSDAEIAARLRLSRHTVRNHLSTLYGKIGVNRRSDAVVWGRERGVTGEDRKARR